MNLGGKDAEDTVILRSLETVNVNGVDVLIPYRQVSFLSLALFRLTILIE